MKVRFLQPELLIEIVACLFAGWLLISEPRGIAVAIPAVSLTAAFLVTCLMPGAAILAWVTPNCEEGLCGAITRSLLVTFIVLGFGTALALQTGLPAAAFAGLLISGSLVALLAAAARGRSLYLTRCSRFTWTSQSTSQRIVSLGLSLCVAVVAILIFKFGYPSPLTPEEVITTRKIAESNILSADRIMQRPGVTPTYLFPALTFAMALMARIASLDTLYVVSNLVAPFSVMSVLAIVAFSGGLFPSLRVKWLATVVILSVIFIDPIAFSNHVGMALILANRYGFAPGVLIPCCLYVFLKMVESEDRSSLVILCLGILTTALVHARDAFQILVFMGAAGIAITIGRPFDSNRLKRVGVALAGSVVLLAFYLLLQTKLAPDVTAVTTGLKDEFKAYLGQMLHDPGQAMWGTMPSQVQSLVGPWPVDNWDTMTRIVFPVLTRLWLPFGVLASAIALAPHIRWQLRACSLMVIGCLIMIRVPIIYTLMLVAVGDPDIGQWTAPLALIAIPICAGVVVASVDAFSSLAMRTTPNRLVAVVSLLLLLTVWFVAPVLQTVLFAVQTVLGRGPDLLIIGCFALAAFGVAGDLFRKSRAATQPSRILILTGLVTLALTLLYFVDFIVVVGFNWFSVALLAFQLGGAVGLTLVTRSQWSIGAGEPPSERLNALRFVPVIFAIAFAAPVVHVGANWKLLTGTDASVAVSKPLLAGWPAPPGVTHLSADPKQLDEELQAQKYVAVSSPVLDYLRNDLPPLRMFYGPGETLTGITMATNHYTVHFASSKLSTDFLYYEKFTPGGKDLLFQAPADASSTALFFQMLQTYQVTDILVTPDYQDAMSRWLPFINAKAKVVEPIFNDNGSTIYAVHLDLTPRPVTA